MGWLEINSNRKQGVGLEKAVSNFKESLNFLMEDFECVLKEMESMGERGGYSQGGSYGERGGGSMGYRDENERRREEYEREMYGERRRR